MKRNKRRVLSKKYDVCHYFIFQILHDLKHIEKAP